MIIIQNRAPPLDRDARTAPPPPRPASPRHVAAFLFAARLSASCCEAPHYSLLSHVPEDDCRGFDSPVLSFSLAAQAPATESPEVYKAPRICSGGHAPFPLCFPD